MRDPVLIDTDIVIDFLRGETKAIKLLKKESDIACFSAITVAEIYAGVKGRKEEKEVERLFAVFPVIPVSDLIARAAGKLAQEYRSSHSLDLPDALIAATTIAIGAQLRTLNTKHFPMIKNLKVPYTKG